MCVCIHVVCLYTVCVSVLLAKCMHACGVDAGLCVSPKDKHLLSGGDDRKIKMWPLFSPCSSLSTLDVTQLQLKTSIALSSATGGEEEEDEDEDGQEQTMPALIDQTVSEKGRKLLERRLEKRRVKDLEVLRGVYEASSFSLRAGILFVSLSLCLSLSAGFFSFTVFLSLSSLSYLS